MDAQDVCLALGISKRCLQNYRDNGLIPHSNVGGKFFYREIITRDSEEFKELAGWIKKAGKAVEEATARIRPTVADEHYMTGDEVCALLHISRRTLQTLRDERLVPYTTIGGKLLYPESALYEVLKKNYRDFRRFRK